MWWNPNLRARILLGYSLTIGLALALALFLALRVGALNGGVQQLNAGATVEAAAGTRVAGQVASTEQLVERYLRQPRQENLQPAQFSLQELTAEVERARVILAASPRQERLDDLDRQLAAYVTTFHSLHTLIDGQEPLRTSLNSHLARSNTLLKGALAGSLDAEASRAIVAALIDAQASLQQANLWASRMAGEQSPTLGENAQAELDKARTLLAENTGTSGSAIEISIDNTINEIALAVEDLAKLQQNLEQVQLQRDTQLDQQGRLLRQQADTIAQDALDSLSAATTQIEQETLRLQLAAFGAILLLLLIAIAASIWLDQAIALPSQQLVAIAARMAPGSDPRPGFDDLGRLPAIFEQLVESQRQADHPSVADGDASSDPTPPIKPRKPRRDYGDDLLP